MDLAAELGLALKEELKLDDLRPEDLHPDTPLVGPEGLGLDSIELLELVVILKRRFKVHIPDRATGERAFKTFGTLVDFVREAKK